MRYIGYPLVGDPKYGPRKTLDANGQVLHAKSLAFTHPRTGEWLKFEAPLPTDFADVIDYIEKMY
ncbi:RluA family pseudouridine synthase, partial [Domibacillus sp. 8LH]